jgi:hypothetical protein
MSLTQVAPGLLNTTAQYYGFKNRVINGAQTIAQRGTSASWTAPAIFSTDRFRSGSNVGWGSGVITAAQSSNAPTGFTNSLGLTVATADALSSNYSYVLVHPIEANNMADFGMGQSWAKTITLSFWVYSSLTGTFSGALQSAGSTNRSWFYTYSIPSANTWTYITVTVTGDTTTPANWLTGTSVGMYLRWHLGASSTYTQSTTNSWVNNSAGYDGVTGQTNLISTNGATFYITGVQLELGATATAFDYRDYGRELVMCQRYFQLIQCCVGRWNNTSASSAIIGCTYNTAMRGSPSTSIQGTCLLENYAGANPTVSSVTSSSGNAFSGGIGYLSFTATGGSGSTVAGYETTMYAGNATSGLALSSEI